ncbi:CIC11C00000000353 [Sungouiella intermedia]|uniref:CIC11C00000000353 n=1 Tax=Sungouiella intermedia TaxID=45354 RepID=A0A1L0DIF1_9ASCO|nr:CIC11C00000000353 [[Candida] intermedia]
MLLNSLVLAILARFVAAASSSSNSCSLSTTLSAASAVLNLNSCPTLEGKIEITGDQVANLDLSSVEVVEADLSIFNSSSIQAINFSGLENVTGSLDFTALTQLNNIDFSKLTSAEELSFVSLPSLAQLNLNSGLANVSSLTLSDTALSSIDSLLNFKTIGVLNVNNNKNISSIDLSTLKTVTEGLTLSFNNDNATIKLENLVWAANLTIQDVGEVSISSLEAVNGSFILGYNGFDSVEFDSLNTVGSSFQVFANDNLESLSLANLTEIDGEFRVFNNSLLQDISLDNLATIKGALAMSGDFGNFTLPKLKEVDGDFSVSSTSEDFSCEAFNDLHDDKKIKGHNYNCSSPSSSVVSSGSATSSGSSKSTGSGSDSSSTSSSSSSSSSSKTGGAGYLTPGMLISTVIGAAFALIM